MIGIGSPWDPETGGPNVVGLDPSLTASGHAWPDGHTEVYGRAGLTTMPYAKRGLALKTLVVSNSNIAYHRGVPDLVVMEELPKQYLDSERAYLWWSLLNVFTSGAVPVLVVQPKQIKLYGTGNGGASKAAVIDAVARRIPQFVTGGNDNRCDAAWACGLGRDLMGAPIVEVPAKHRKALDKLVMPERFPS